MVQKIGGKTTKSRVLLDLFLKISKDKIFWDCWRTSNQWVDILVAVYPDAAMFDFNASDMSRALSVDPTLKHCAIQYGSLSNPHGIYFDKHKKMAFAQQQSIAVLQTQ